VKRYRQKIITESLKETALTMKISVRTDQSKQAGIASVNSIETQALFIEAFAEVKTTRKQTK
jgi:hypothetical protein